LTGRRLSFYQLLLPQFFSPSFDLLCPYATHTLCAGSFLWTGPPEKQIQPHLSDHTTSRHSHSISVQPNQPTCSSLLSSISLRPSCPSFMPLTASRHLDPSRQHPKVCLGMATSAMPSLASSLLHKDPSSSQTSIPRAVAPLGASGVSVLRYANFTAIAI